MPAYNPRGVRIRLCASDLAETITPAKNLTRKRGAQAASNADKAEKKLRDQQPYLPETSVPIAGDKHGYSINFIPGILTPFLQVQVGPDAFVSAEDEEGLRKGDAVAVSNCKSHGKVNTIEANANTAVVATRSKRSHHRAFHADNRPPVLTHRPASLDHELRLSPRNNIALKPKALSVHVLLSDLTYLPSSTGHPQSLKIEVFFNGMLVQSVFILPSDVKNGVKSNYQCFAGTRVALLAERPWIIVPPGQKADGHSRISNTTASAEDRWMEISAALFDAAEGRGIDEHGKAPPSATYLEELATMTMPEAVNHMQKLGGRNFGIIDVVITAGSGRKADGKTHAQYLHEPLRLIDEEFKVRKVKAESSDEMYDIPEEEEPGEEAVPAIPSERDAEGEIDSELVDDDNDLPRGQLQPEPSPSLRANGLKAAAPSATVMLSRPTPQVPIAQMYSMAAQESFIVTSTSGTPYLSAGLSRPNLAPQHRRSTFTASGLPIRFPSSAPSTPPIHGLADPFWNPPFGPSQYDSSNAASSNHGLPLSIAPSPVPSNVSQGWFSQPGAASNVSLLGAPLRPGLPFASRHQVDDTNPLQTLDCLPPGPPPPVSGFSTPRRYDSWKVDPDLPRLSFCISRLVITRALEVIVDYHWQVPQLVRIGREQHSMAESELDQEDDLEVFDPEESSGQEYMGTPVAKRRRSSIRRKVPATPPATSPTLGLDSGMTTSVGHRKRSTVHHGHSTHNFGIPETLGPALRSRPSGPSPFATGPGRQPAAALSLGVGGSSTFARHRSSDFIKPGPLTSRVSVPPRPTSRATSNNAKGVPVILDDPESLFRRKSKTSPGTQVARTPPPSSVVLPGPDPSGKGSRVQELSRAPTSTPKILNLLDTVDSSPLSSVPDLLLTPDLRCSSSAAPSNAKRDYKPRTKNVSGLKLATLKTKRTFDPTVNVCEDNPKLNEDCVIAYAEGDKGPLRQVRSERQGWFHESEVVVGMRFFIPG
ncbi:hypothetical protein BDV96DRAFT_602548 [Lophiotrema nucula]|uniref:Uncharacterized protein n=1 Tax=Lophiotrema nucula TaxID=690887 RepID=A0A6A5YZ51_9PLEO|nr:hypothetical protein BDV96DRAFT_602548 [Lophiotrema nucula]